MIGWIKTHRKMRQWEWYNDLPVRVVFQHLLLSVEHVDGSFKGEPVKAGQRVFSTAKLAAECCLSVQQTKTALSKLQSTNDVTIKSTNKFSIITITNWESYQVGNQQSNQQSTSGATSSPATSKEEINITNPNGLDAHRSVKDVLWQEGLQSLKRQTGQSDRQCRSLVGRFLKTANDDCAKVLTAINQSEADRTIDPVAWITAAVQPKKQNPRQKWGAI